MTTNTFREWYVSQGNSIGTPCPTPSPTVSSMPTPVPSYSAAPTFTSAPTMLPTGNTDYNALSALYHATAGDLTSLSSWSNWMSGHSPARSLGLACRAARGE